MKKSATPIAPCIDRGQFWPGIRSRLSSHGLKLRLPPARQSNSSPNLGQVFFYIGQEYAQVRSPLQKSRTPPLPSGRNTPRPLISIDIPFLQALLHHSVEGGATFLRQLQLICQDASPTRKACVSPGLKMPKPGERKPVLPFRRRLRISCTTRSSSSAAALSGILFSLASTAVSSFFVILN